MKSIIQTNISYYEIGKKKGEREKWREEKESERGTKIARGRKSEREMKVETKIERESNRVG